MGIDFNKLSDLMDELDASGKSKEVDEICEIIASVTNSSANNKKDIVINSVNDFLIDNSEEKYIKAQDSLKDFFISNGGLQKNNSNEEGVDVVKRLSVIADKLDAIDASKEADLVDDIIQKIAKPDMSKLNLYDSEKHRNEQIREDMRSKKEPIDKEDVKEHSLKTMSKPSSLSTRHCPDHIGVSLCRIGDMTYQCPLDNQIYNWETGWTDSDGHDHSGGSVAAQTPDTSDYGIPHRLFESRSK